MKRMPSLGPARRISRWSLSQLPGAVTLVSMMCIGGCPNSEAADPADATVMDAGSDANAPECLPSDDMCPTGEYCEYTSGRLQCIAEGVFASPPGPDVQTECPDGVCARGFICMTDTRTLPTISRPSCYQVCTLGLDAEPVFAASDCTIGRHTCAPAVGDGGERLPFGLCYYGSP